jgi:hypothetical protein
MMLKMLRLTYHRLPRKRSSLTLQELPPEYGVTLSGSPENPVIENRSGKTVIAYVFVTATRNGYTSLDQPLLATSMQPAGIPDGGSPYARGAMPVNPPGPIEGWHFNHSFRDFTQPRSLAPAVAASRQGRLLGRRSEA